MKKILVNVLCLLFVAFVSAFVALTPTPKSYTGWVGDAACGVKCASTSHKACAISCLKKKGGTYIFVSNDGKKTIYTIDNPTSVKGHEGDLITVQGVVTGAKIHIATLRTTEIKGGRKGGK